MEETGRILARLCPICNEKKCVPGCFVSSKFVTGSKSQHATKQYVPVCKGCGAKFSNKTKKV